MSLTQQQFETYFEQKEPIRRYFIISYGPPGSGKSTVMKKALGTLKVQTEQLIHVNVDDILSKIVSSHNKKLNNDTYAEYRHIADRSEEHTSELQSH